MAKSKTKELEIVDAETSITSSIVPSNGHTPLIPAQGQLIMDAMNGNVDEWAIQTRPGPGGKSLSYLPHGYIRDQLNKVFGPFWSEIPIDISPGRKYDIVEYQVERENPKTHIKEAKTVREVTVMTELRIRIYSSDGRLVSEETHPGSGGKIWENNISFTDTLQAAQSEALKRAAFPLGRKFGLQLYYDSEERRAEWQEKFDKEQKKVNEPPKNIAQLLGRLEKEQISDEEFIQVIGRDISDITEKDVPDIWEALVNYRSKTED